MTVTPDPYNFTNGNVADAEQVDARFLPLYAALNGALDVDNLLPSVKQKLGLSDSGVVRRGKSIIGGAEVRASAAYGTLGTPDQVQNVVLPTDALLLIVFQATWQESVLGAAKAAIFLGAQQLKMPLTGFAAPVVQEASIVNGGGIPNLAATLSTSPAGLIGGSTAANYSGDVATGQIVGITQGGSGGGMCVVFAAAGTYTVSVQFKASSGTTTVGTRKLWVATMAF